jgi:hypothetical protein
MLPTGESSLIQRDWPPWKKSDGSTIAGDTMLNPDFKEFIASLNDNGVHYLVRLSPMYQGS